MPEFDIAIPSSFTENLSSTLQRSFAVSNLARAAACFGVRRIYIYPDPLSTDRTVYKDVVKLLKYLITPPYLKKVLFEFEDSLAYVGALPPVKLPLFQEKVRIKDIEYPMYRIGYTFAKKRGDLYLIDVGLDKPVAVKGKRPPPIAMVKIVKNAQKYLIGELVDDEEVREKGLYKGYSVLRSRESIVSLVKKYKGVKIGLSKYGDYIGDLNISKIRGEIIGKGRSLLVLGSHSYGLKEILSYYNVEPRNLFDYYINLVYNQKVETIRIEEAVWIALSIMDFIVNSKL